MIGQLFGGMIVWLIGLIILYLVISNAVKDGINKSVVGKLIENKYGDLVDTRRADNDLDKD